MGHAMQLGAGSLLLTFLALPLFPQAPPALSVGFYHWGGSYSASPSQGVDAIAAIGGHIARLAISPRMNIDYHIASACIAGFTLAGAMQDPDVKKALDNPAITAFVLTAYDGATFGDCETHRYLNPSFYTSAGERAIVQEYSDMTLYLYRTYEHTGKQFIISNWESDNDVYCGAASTYATDANFRTTCNASYADEYSGNATPFDSFQGLKLWFQDRERGIEGGRNRALALGLGGTMVYFAPEICIAAALHNAGLPSALYNVVPFVKFDYVSYSSYQSIASSDPQNTLLQDLKTIESVTSSSNILIGEIMTAAPGESPETFIQVLHGVMDAALRWGVHYLIYWSLYGTDASGVYDASGQLTPVGEFFKQYLPGGTCVFWPHGHRPPARSYGP